MDYMDEGIWIEVLKRVPAESLLRFKCVCRLWHSIISDPMFVQAQLRTSLQENPKPSERLLLHEYPRPSSLDVEEEAADSRLEDGVFMKLDCQPIDPNEGFYIEGSCHGLVSLRAGDLRRFFLYNPTTRELRKLPKSPRAPGHHLELFFGFGYDTLRDDYKVVLGTGGIGSMPTVDVFSLKSDSWRSIGECKYDFLRRDGKYSDGFLHWLNMDMDDNVYKTVSFDIAEEEFHEALFPLPSFTFRGGDTELRVTGCGWLVAYRHLNESIEVWTMKGCCSKSTWTRMCYIWREQFRDDCCLRGCTRLFPLMKDGEIVLCVKWGEHSIGIYDPGEDCLKAFQLLGTRPGSGTMRAYVESLVSLRVDKRALVERKSTSF